MPTAENAKIQYEAGQSVTPMGALSDSGDQKTFNSAASLFSGRSGYAPVVRPDGLITGGVVSPAAAAGDNNVDVAALTAYIGGTKLTVGAQTDQAITRPSTDVAKVNSITVTGAGAIAVISGTDGASQTFSETRGGDGGPPHIPTTSIEIAQVRVTSSTDAAIESSEIFQVLGVHMEKYDYPLWTENNGEGSVTFDAALPAIHTGDVPKGVFASYAEPIFADVPEGTDFVPPEDSHSVSSKQIYGKTKGSSSSSLGQGSFTAYLQDGVTDGLVALKNEILWFRHYPDRYKTAHLLCQGKLGISRQFPADDDINATCTISAAEAAVEKAA